MGNHDENYIIYHLHSALSNLTAGTGADSITSFYDYIAKAKESGMKAMAFSEHGSVLNWIKKKEMIEKAGMKYIHANEVYLTKKIDRERDEFDDLILDAQGNNIGKLKLERDNFHYMMIAKNYDGVLELNKLTSNSYNKDGHYYYQPRITFDELKSTSDNILMTSACLASPLWKLYKKAYGEFGLQDADAKRELDDMLGWMESQRHRMFLEVQYHAHPEQVEFNQMLMRYSKELKIPLIAGTDTHALNTEHAETRSLFLKSKGVSYADEDMFDLTFKNYEEVVGMFDKQGALPPKIYMEAIHNTNVMADMVEEFKLDKTPKYPKMYDKPVEVFKKMINEGVKKRGFDKFPAEKKKQYYDRIKEEMATYIKLDTVDYMLLQKNIIDWSQARGIYHGYGRGSVNGSLIAYALGITEMDSIKHNLNFFRFLNPDRISLPDIDIDFPPSRRQEVIDYLASLDGIEFAEIITFNTLALKGSIREIGKGLRESGKDPSMTMDVIDDIAKAVEKFNQKDHIDKSYRLKYPELFKHVDLIMGTTVSMGSHPSGYVVSPITLSDHVSTVFTKDSKYRVTSVNMKELDGENYVKLDILGLANIELVNEVCKLVNIERLTPDNIDTNDIAVWKSLRESTLGVFQFESDSAYAYLKQLFSDETLENIKNNVGDISYIDLLSLANGAIRPSGDSYRDRLAQGIPNDNGHVALNESLSETLGYLVFQEQIMKFLTDFCEHTGAESDSVRRGIAKKEGSEQFIIPVKEKFTHFMMDNYDETEERIAEIAEPFLQVIKDASGYGFSVNHSSPYSYLGYAGAWLRYHYPLQFLTVVLNVMKDEKVSKIVAFANQNNYEIRSVTFGNSRASYSYNEEEQNVYKGISSIKYLNVLVAEQLFELAQEKYYDRDDWVGLLVDILKKTSADTRQMEILIRLDFFKEFGAKEVLLEVYHTMVAKDMGTSKKKADIIMYPQFADKTIQVEVRHKKTDKLLRYEQKTIKQTMKYDDGLADKTKIERLKNIMAYEVAVKANPPRKIEMYEQISYEKEVLGYAFSTWEQVDGSYALVLDVNKKYTPKITLYQVKTGKEFVVKINKKKFYTDDDQMLYVGDIIKVLDVEKQDAWKMEDKKWVRNPNVQEMHLNKCKIVRKSVHRGK